MTREQELRLIYKHTHRDFRDKGRILVLREAGTCLVPLESLTDEEIARKLPYAIKREGSK